MRSDDDGFADRQVASSTLLRNTSLTTPVPFRTETFDLRAFASVSLYLEPTVGSVYPCYVTVEWWADRARTILVRTDKVDWSAGVATRLWTGTIPCRSDWMTLTLDSAGAATVAMIVVGQSRTPTGIAQQLPTGAGGLPPFCLLFRTEAVPAATNGPDFWIPPWFGDIQILSYWTGAAASNSYLAIDFIGGQGISDAFAIPLNGTAGGFVAGGLTYGPPLRLAAAGSQIRLRHINLSGAVASYATTVQPITGL